MLRFDGGVNIEPVTLTGARVQLVPLSLEHLDALCEIGLDPTLWQLTGGRNTTRDDMRAYIERALARDDTQPFATTLVETGEVVGCTRFAEISVHHRRAEIGWTWVGVPWQRSFVNTEAKLLMLRHVFDTWGFQRVELKTHIRNEASRNAILRIGATQEGILRRHMIQPDGSTRDSVLFSITDDEWPEVRTRLEKMCQRD